MIVISTHRLSLFEPATIHPVPSPVPAAEVIATVGPLLQVLLREIAAAEAGVFPAAKTDEAAS